MHTALLRLFTPVAVALPLTAQAGAQNWSDDLESYAPGSALETQGGWEGWDGANTAFTIVSTAQANSGTQSMQPNPGADTVRQFTTGGTGTWIFEAQVFIPTGFASNLDMMVMNRYQHFGPYEWGSWIVFDGPSGMVECNCGGFGANAVPMSYDRWIPIREVIDLDNDTADVFYDGQLFASYIWTDGYSGSTSHQIAGIDAIDLYSTGTGSGMYIDDLELYELSGTVGTAYCAPNAPNSTGSPGTLSAFGFNSAASNDVTLTAEALPLNAFGFFLTSQTQGLIMNPGGSQGDLCLAGAIGRYVGPGEIQNSGAAGSFSLALDLSQTPQPTGFVSVMAGETWNYQGWYRDAVGGSATSNLTHAVSVTYN